MAFSFLALFGLVIAIVGGLVLFATKRRTLAITLIAGGIMMIVAVVAVTILVTSQPA